MTAKTKIDALASAAAAARAGAISAQTSHDGATVMIKSAEKAMVQLRDDLTSPRHAPNLIRLDRKLGAYIPSAVSRSPVARPHTWSIAVAGLLAVTVLLSVFA